MARKIYCIRHGETIWTLSGQHTGRTDISLTKQGQNQAKAIGEQLKLFHFDHLFCSPLKRAKETCDLAHLSIQPKIEPLLQEWDYGNYEGLTTEEIRKNHPDWNLFIDGAEQGESVQKVKDRADQFLDQISLLEGDIALFSHGHFLKVLAARFLKLPPSNGQLFSLSPGSLTILGYERESPVLLLLNWTLFSK